MGQAWKAILGVHPVGHPRSTSPVERVAMCPGGGNRKQSWESRTGVPATNILHIYNRHLPCILRMFTWHLPVMPYLLIVRKSCKAAMVTATLQKKKLRLGEVI